MSTACIQLDKDFDIRVPSLRNPMPETAQRCGFGHSLSGIFCTVCTSKNLSLLTVLPKPKWFGLFYKLFKISHSMETNGTMVSSFHRSLGE